MCKRKRRNINSNRFQLRFIIQGKMSFRTYFKKQVYMYKAELTHAVKDKYKLQNSIFVISVCLRLHCVIACVCAYTLKKASLIIRPSTD